MTFTKDELSKLLDESAERGAKKALASVGLHDEEAFQDIKALRDILENFRIIKRGALVQLGKMVTTILLTCLVVLAGFHWSVAGK